jgi:hypothetical protein
MLGRSSAGAAPVISGTAFPGETLTSTNARQWYADGNVISGQTASTYVIRYSDIGKVIRQSNSNTITILSDADAVTWIGGVQTADTTSLEDAVAAAMHKMVKALKDAGEWSGLSIIRCYAGPRTLAGCAVPVKGAAPTLVNFVSGDINRKTGIKGNGSTKYINHNHNNNANSQDDQSMWMYLTEKCTEIAATSSVFMGAGFTDNGSTHFLNFGVPGSMTWRNRNTSPTPSIGGAQTVGLIGMSRSVGGSYSGRIAGASSSAAVASQTPFNGNVFSFARNNSGTPISHSNHRSAIEGIGNAWAGDGSQIESIVATYLSTLNSIL